MASRWGKLGSSILLGMALACLPDWVLAQQWQLTRLDGSQITAQVTSISDGQIQWDEETSALDAFRSLKTPHSLLGSDPSTTRVDLRYGGVLFARDVQIREGQVIVETDVTELEYDLFDIRCIQIQKGQGASEREELLAEPSRETDRLLVTTSQGPRTISGLIEGLDGESIKFDYQGEVRSIALDKILAILPAQLDSGRQPSALVTCIDRSQLPAQTVTLEQDQIAIQWGGRTTSLSLGDVASIRIRSDREIYVSDLTPNRSEVQTSLAPQRPIAIDTNVVNGPLTLKMTAPDSDDLVRTTFDKGIGTQARSRISYSIPDGCQRLTGWVGIDTATGEHGSCTCSILVDGIQVFSEAVSGTAPAVRIDVTLDQARELELLVEPGPMLDLSDWVDWADLRLLK